MKLYRVDIMNDCEEDIILVVAKSKEEAEQKVIKMDWECLMLCSATEINIVDGYKIILEREGYKNENKYNK